jgi:hypothetical protein
MHEESGVDASGKLDDEIVMLVPQPVSRLEVTAGGERPKLYT